MIIFETMIVNNNEVIIARQVTENSFFAEDSTSINLESIAKKINKALGKVTIASDDQNNVVVCNNNGIVEVED